MKRKIFAAVAAAVAMASATSAGSTEFVQLSRTDLTDCQLAHLASCYKFTGDYVACYYEAQDYAC
jgi:hypothetical protein